MIQKEKARQDSGVLVYLCTVYASYKEFSKAIRTGDFDLYLHSLPRLGSILFAFNHPNYVLIVG